MKFITIALFAICFLCPVQVLAFNIHSDSSWFVSKEVSDGWTSIDYDDSLWVKTKAPTRGLCNFKEHPVFFTEPMWHPTPKNKEKVYFRKTFIIDSEILEALLRVNFDDDAEVYVNNTLVGVDASGGVENDPMVFDVKDHLVVGENILSLMAFDSYGGCQWAQADLEISFDEGVKLEVPLLKQSDDRWADTTYDHGDKQNLFCGSTIKDCGCVLTSLAMVLQYHGVTKLQGGELLDPDSLNDYFNKGTSCTDDGCVSKGYVFGNVRWNAVNQLSKFAHDVYSSPKVQFSGVHGYSVEKVSEEISHKNPVILKSPHESHWFIATGEKPSTFYIHDPLFERYTLSDTYNNSASTIRTFEKVNSNFSLIEIYTKETSQILLTDMYGRKTGYDSVTKNTLQEIPRSAYVFEESVSSNGKDGVWWLSVNEPAKGIYKVDITGKDPAVLYVADENATEVMEYTDSRSKQFHYDSESEHFYIPMGLQSQSCKRKVS